MKTLRVILKDQLSLDLSALKDLDCSADLILMCETRDEFTHVQHHQKKIAFILSAMRHFGKELEEKGYPLIYTKLDDPLNTDVLETEISRICKLHEITHIVMTWPGEYRILENLKELNIEFREDDRFLASREDFLTFATHRKELRMEFFYRQMRQKYSILMEDGQPKGGQWNYDAQNRKFPKGPLSIPSYYKADPDAITLEVMELVKENFSHHFGKIHPFHFAVTRDQALEALHLFIKERLPFFGDYQDAMIQEEPWMYHSHISFYLNIGLLNPLECIRLAETSDAPLNAVEGFIRQILGWREYVRGIYWLKMPGYKTLNFLNATGKLPEFFWNADTKMNCLKQCIKETQENAYAHHIQRLMVIGNFALIAGLSPDEVNNWYLIVYADAHEWVELPNVTGMILFADGGILGSKPYAASGSYINKMSNYCKNCHYKVAEKTGESACPFNYLYWDFLIRNQEKLEGNHRMSIPYATLAKTAAEKIELIQDNAQKFLGKLS